MNVLITGSSGFLGREIINKIKNNSRIFGLSTKDSKYNFKLQNEIPNFAESFELVIHAAGKAHFSPKNNEEKKIFFEVNVKGTKNLLEALEAAGFPKRFVFISSVAVYGLDKGNDISEEHPLLAKDPYGLSKIKAEELVLDWCKEHNITCTILRLPLLVGDNPPGNLGAMIKGIKRGYYFNIAGGFANKSMVLAEDVVHILIKVSTIGGIYNLTDGYHPSFYELSNAIAKQNGKSKPYNLPYNIAKIIAFVGDVLGAKFPLDSNKLKKISSDLTFDDSKAREVLGWNPQKVLDFYAK